MRLFLTIFSSVLLLKVLSYPQEKAKVLSDKEIYALSDKSDTANAKVVNDEDVKLNFKGNGGWVKNQAGTGEATQKGKGDKFNVIGPDGKKATGTVDKNKKVAVVKDAKGGVVNANGADEHLVKADVNGKNQYHITRDDRGNAEVFPVNSDKSAHQVSNLRSNTDNVVVRTPNKPERVEKLNAQKDPSGKVTNVQTSDAENAIPGIPIGSKNFGKMNYKGQSSSDLQVGKSFGATNNDRLSMGAAGEVSSDYVDTKPCYTGAGGEDALDQQNGIKIDQKSIRFELIKDQQGMYNFPSCFNAFATVFVPPNIDVDDLGVNNQVTTPLAGGEMQCDNKVSCRDRTTSNRPSGSCFFCDFCNKNQPQGAFGIGSESNICEAKASRNLPLKWKLCPPEGAQPKFIPFLPSGKRASGDIVAVLRLFQRKNKKWVEVACKQSSYSFKVGLAGQRGFGSKQTNTQLEKPQGNSPSVRGANPFGRFGG